MLTVQPPLDRVQPTSATALPVDALAQIIATEIHNFIAAEPDAELVHAVRQAMPEIMREILQLAQQQPTLRRDQISHQVQERLRGIAREVTHQTAGGVSIRDTLSVSAIIRQSSGGALLLQYNLLREPGFIRPDALSLADHAAIQRDLQLLFEAAQAAQNAPEMFTYDAGDSLWRYQMNSTTESLPLAIDAASLRHVEVSRDAQGQFRIIELLAPRTDKVTGRLHFESREMIVTRDLAEKILGTSFDSAEGLLKALNDKAAFEKLWQAQQDLQQRQQQDINESRRSFLQFGVALDDEMASLDTIKYCPMVPCYLPGAGIMAHAA